MSEQITFTIDLDDFVDRIFYEMERIAESGSHCIRFSRRREYESSEIELERSLMAYTIAKKLAPFIASQLKHEREEV